MKETIPLKVLICDADINAGATLSRALDISNDVIASKQVDTLELATHEAKTNNYNAVFVDPISPGLDDATKFIFRIRESLPEIVLFSI